jgi:hypothetical protein
LLVPDPTLLETPSEASTRVSIADALLFGRGTAR